jgi:hypothetical protein
VRGDGWFARDLKTLALSAGIAALFGALHNVIDVRISPWFYTIVKQAPDDVPVSLYAIYIGLTRGAVLGILLGVGVCVVNDHGHAPALSVRQLSRWLFLPVLLAAAGSVVGFMIGSHWWLEVVERMQRKYYVRITSLAPPQAWSVAVVNTMHVGIYVGAIIGALHAWRGVYRAHYTLKPQTHRQEDARP